MPINQVIDPGKVRKAGYIKFRDIPLNQYKSDFVKEERKWGREKLLAAYYHMLLIRQFELVLDSIKKTGAYRGLEYNHQGAAHLSVGQEAAAVGQSMALSHEDYIFGSHRSHGEVLAKCLWAILTMEEGTIDALMRGYMGGEILRVVEKDASGDLRDLGVDYVLYGVMAEIFARKTGFNRGLGGSMHTFFSPFGSMPNNAIVGGSADIAVGAALYKRINQQPGIVIANIGDASMGCGPVWEAMMMASMDQYKLLWDIGGAPPVMFNFFNNFYGMGGQPAGETMGFGVLARVGAGGNPDAMHAERVDGYNPLAVAEATLRKKEILLGGRGPVLLDVITYRISGHSPSDSSSYRSREELGLWQAGDCILAYESYLKDRGVLDEVTISDTRARVGRKLFATLEKSASLKISPRLEGCSIENVMFSRQRMESGDGEHSPRLLIAAKDNPRVLSLTGKIRSAAGSKKPSATRLFTFRDALFEALLHRFSIDSTMAAWGEDVRDWGGAFAVYRGLTESLPYHRLFNSPISEGAIVGSGVGYALCGGRAVVELMYCDFLGRAGDEVFNQMAKWQGMSAGMLKMPLTLRVSIGAKYGAQHSQDWTALLAHIPGLKVYFPATPTDAKGMLNLALSGTDPVVFLESQKLYGIGEQFEKGGVPKGYYETPEGVPAIRRQGKDITIITLGAMIYTAVSAAEELQERFGLSTELIDLRFVNPLNYDVLVESVRKTGRVLLSSDAVERGNFLHNVASNLTALCFDYLDAPPVVLGARNWISPAAELEEEFFPQKEWIIDLIHERILPLEGYTPKSAQGNDEQLRRYKSGV
ncbi:Acetoin dehydrogenase E1 component alpha-subunit / Acetoin dehydrogenase E1 component beta-subunit [Olavius algarvensis spirochete endosymbiont]|uniref:alpha-ketoacid dehydrogenase subunit alpha/beta n=1 Tax=Olavius algarvensis spirochete endosymbiont TaxID=260710 RepID=UPI000F0EC6D8|nr:thiamine pyrophosphate-dependent enzyme [Olavius algarvensis spirochete endosymbiont]VDA99740.1 Acetoin dehydrogenase E1 component alpha-subunit / Acetoin dehydrogenase E1 component beta-subunit [Olavius algarvensis spirochete endosymbiont]